MIVRLLEGGSGGVMYYIRKRGIRRDGFIRVLRERDVLFFLAFVVFFGEFLAWDWRG